MNSVRFFGGFLCTILYLGMVLLASQSFANSHPIDSTPAEAGIHHLGESSPLASSFQLADGSVNVPSPIFKINNRDVHALSQVAAFSFQTALTFHTLRTRQLLVRHRSSNIIFPFHYFW